MALTPEQNSRLNSMRIEALFMEAENARTNAAIHSGPQLSQNKARQEIAAADLRKRMNACANEYNESGIDDYEEPSSAVDFDSENAKFRWKALATDLKYAFVAGWVCLVLFALYMTIFQPAALRSWWTWLMTRHNATLSCMAVTLTRRGKVDSA
jgi:hypothetical protein